MSNHPKITRDQLVRAMGENPATYVVPAAPTPEEFLKRPFATAFFAGFRPAYLAYSPLQAWFDGRGADFLGEWRAAHGPRKDRRAFSRWAEAAIHGHPLGFGCDVLDLRRIEDRVRFARYLDLLGGADAPLAAEFLRIHCVDAETSGWTPPTGEERLGEYRREIEARRARASGSAPCRVARGMPGRFARPETREAALAAMEAARASGMLVDRLVFHPSDGAPEGTMVSHLYVVAQPDALAAAAQADTLDEARRRLGQDYSGVRVYGEADHVAEDLADVFATLRAHAERFGRRAA